MIEKIVYLSQKISSQVSTVLFDAIVFSKSHERVMRERKQLQKHVDMLSEELEFKKIIIEQIRNVFSEDLSKNDFFTGLGGIENYDRSVDQLPQKLYDFDRFTRRLIHVLDFKLNRIVLNIERIDSEDFFS